MSPISRRSVLTTSTLSALGVGLMNLTPALALAEPAAPPSITSAPVGYSEALAAWLAEWTDVHTEAVAEAHAALLAIQGHLPPDVAWTLVDRYDVAKNDLRDLGEAHTIEMIAQHFPGIAGAI